MKMYGRVLAKDPFVLLCMYVEDGLDNIEVGVGSELPAEGSTVTHTLCGSHTGTVSTSEEITVDCVATARYLIIQSLDTTPEKLCMAEVAVYVTAGIYATHLRTYWCHSYAAYTALFL